MTVEKILQNRTANRGDTASLRRAMSRAQRGEKLTVGFLGGSITQGSLASAPEKCYAYLTYQWWADRFPQAHILYRNAGIGGTTSHFGAARVTEDLLTAEPDVVFVEFSVNDDDTPHFLECYEGLVRKILSCGRKPAVVLLLNRFYSDGHSARRIHSMVGKHYDLPCVGLGDCLYPMIEKGVLAMEDITPDGLHPNDKGHSMLAEIICSFLEETFGELESRETDIDKNNKNNLPRPLTMNRYEKAYRLRSQDIVPQDCRGFQADTRTQSRITEIFCGGWYAREAGAELTFRVKASCLAVQYRRTIQHPAPKALAILDGCEEKAVLLDADFDEDWGDCLYLQTLLEEEECREHTLTIRLVQEEKKAELPFYLVSLLVS